MLYAFGLGGLLERYLCPDLYPDHTETREGRFTVLSDHLLASPIQHRMQL